MNICDHAQFDALRLDFSQKCTTSAFELGYLLSENRQGKINTQMDIQRKYVWTEAREQEMWDSLLLNVRIPEFHAIMDGRIRKICDGKQRFTCIFRILEDKIRYKRFGSREENQWLFDYASRINQRGQKIIPTSIVFSQLPQYLQDAILSSTLYIACYSNLTREEEIALFRKINNGVPLSEFSRGMASHYYMRKEFTDPLMNTSASIISLISNELITDEEDLETILIRALLLCDNPKQKETLNLQSNENQLNLQPNGLEHYYEKYKDVTIIDNWLYEFQKLFDRCENSLAVVFDECRSKRTIVPFILEGIYRHPELTKEQIKQLCQEMKDYRAGRGSDLGPRKIGENRFLVEQKIISILNKN